ncbi:uracil-DNA glycosylase [Anaerorhabdus furcosa]|uniref:Uracil-DNA glycosylase n=1 Tax=Anaerorhabdus furcosa TaxID=118967 RepID=A0A1T4K4D6_9FIRM|nr:uracil-DNA glycosylase [Anaerorhabdus furcosa]SJZ37291.1 Uracil-DNA glycosylase [Anaerorhabdus furcosa]
MFKNEWTPFLKEEFEKDYFKRLSAFIHEEYEHKKIYPIKQNVFAAFENTDFSDVKVVILGQDPYHQPNQAHGMCFSVQKGVAIPPSLLNIYKELYNDLGYPIAKHGYLMSWAKQGVFLLNTILTVEDSKPLSHKGKGWEIFTDEVIRKLNRREKPMVFILWGRNARDKKVLITNPNHLILEASHPSPLSAHTGFFQTKPFSKCNQFLEAHHQAPVMWKIED